MEEIQKEKNRGFFKRPFSCTKRIIIIVGIIILVGVLLFFLGSSSSYEEYGYENCNVAGINLHGSLSTYIPIDIDGNNIEGYEDSISSEDMIYYLQEAEDDLNIKAILIEVDSYGGSPVAGEEIANMIKRSSKPVVAVIRQSGISGAYLAISGADQIFASKNSDVGSIGVTMSYLDNVKKNEKEGLSYIQLSSGKFKDTGDANKSLSEEEKALFMRDVKIMHENFIKDVSENRNMPIEKVRALADGSTVLGEKAKELGLIDQIGGIYEVEKYLQEKIGEKPEACWR